MSDLVGTQIVGFLMQASRIGSGGTCGRCHAVMVEEVGNVDLLWYCKAFCDV